MSIVRLDAAQAAQAVPELAGLLQNAVHAGAALGFLPPVTDAAAHAYWHSVAAAVTDGSRLLWVARVGETLAGTVQLDLALRPNGLHRAEVMKVMVHAAHRRRGLGRALLLAVEAEARRIGRTTLVLDTRQGDAAEALYAGLGWVRAGVIPDFARSADGSLHATVIYYRLLA